MLIAEVISAIYFSGRITLRYAGKIMIVDSVIKDIKQGILLKEKIKWNVKRIKILNNVTALMNPAKKKESAANV